MNVPRNDAREKNDLLPWFFVIAVVVVVCVFMFLFVSIVHSSQLREEQKTQAEKQRADLLQQSVDSLRKHIEEEATAAVQDRAFFELVRQLLVAQGPDQKRALLNQLKSFNFTDPSSSRRPTTTTTTRPSSPPTTRAPPSSTTTTTTTSPSTTMCVGTPVTTICK